MRQRLLILLFSLTLSIAINAQISGGQIRRQGTNKKAQVKTPRRATTINPVYPSRDDMFQSDAILPEKGSFDISNLSVNYTLLPSPDFDGHMLKRNINRTQITLKQVSCKQNDITDDDKWLTENQLFLHSQKIYNPTNKFLQYRIKTGGYHVLLFGEGYGNVTKVIVTDINEKKLYIAYDFENFRFAPKRQKSDSRFNDDQDILDIVIEGNIMYVAHSGHTYSISYGNQTGYITAINMLTDEILWTSLPKTNNCSQIEIVGNSIIAGYGFTQETDFLFVLDKYSGHRVQKIVLKKSPDYIVVKEDLAYVRTYNYDYVFSIK